MFTISYNNPPTHPKRPFLSTQNPNTRVIDPSFSEYKRGELCLTSSYNPLRKKACSTTGRHILRNLWQDPSPPISTPYTHPKRSPPPSPPPTFLHQNLFTTLRSSQAWNDASSTTNKRLRNLLSKTKTSSCSPFSLSLLLLLLFHSRAKQNTEPVCKLDSELGKKWDLQKNKFGKTGKLRRTLSSHFRFSHFPPTQILTIFTLRSAMAITKVYTFASSVI